jgi:hypothetical protein
MDPSPLEPLVLDPSPGNGLLIFNREVPWTTERLRRSGIAFQAVPAGNYTLFLLQGRQENRLLRPAQILADQNPAKARELLRGLPAGRRWSTGTPQRPGLSLTVDLGRVQGIQSLALHCPGYPRDYPRGLEAAVSADGLRWEKTGLHLSEPLVFTGQILLGWQGPTQRYRFDPVVNARFLRFILSESDPVYWWSVESLQIFGPE